VSKREKRRDYTGEFYDGDEEKHDSFHAVAAVGVSDRDSTLDAMVIVL
jgi:hypothetical protein